MPRKVKIQNIFIKDDHKLYKSAKAFFLIDQLILNELLVNRVAC